MASFRVHEDQENRVPELRVKQCTVAGIHQKRSVLSVIDNRINQKQVRLYRRGFMAILRNIFYVASTANKLQSRE